jgi:hypothetical protein
MGYSGILEHGHIYNAVSIGLRKGLFSLLLTHKVGDDTEFKMAASKELYDSINMGVGVNGCFLEPEKAELSFGFSQPIDALTSTALSFTYNPFYRETGVKVEF